MREREGTARVAPDIVETPEGDTAQRPDLTGILLLSVFVVATCGLVYELLAGTIATYLLGDSVTQFSTVIGTYLFAMGLGSWLSRYVHGGFLKWFVRVEILIALIGGSSAAAFFMLFPMVSDFRPILYGAVLATGILVGLEIPLLIRILKGRYTLGDLVSNVLTYDYIGALVASLLFPLVLVPFVGLVRGGFVIGLANILVALLLVFRLRRDRALAAERVAAVLVAGVLLAGAAWSEKIEAAAEARIYEDPVVFATSSHHQRITLTRRGSELRFYLNGILQFSSLDEQRYHEALVWPALGRVETPADVLILGGGDGLALREVLRHPHVRRVTLVDLDPAVTELFSAAPELRRLNRDSFADPRVTAINADAYTWVRDAGQRFDVVIVDFPDPTNYSIGRLYSLGFYRILKRRLAPGGMVVVQSVAPVIAPHSFAMVGSTLEAAGFEIRPYHTFVPSFGEWGYTLASTGEIPDRRDPPVTPGSLSADDEAGLFVFPAGLVTGPPSVNTLANQALVRTFAEEWRRYVQQ
jgi:spermidine synthase